MRYLLCALIFWAPTLRANDSFASVKAGELTLGKTNEVSMEKEALYVSRHKVKVDYEFKNVSKKDVTSVVAFPLGKMNSETPYTAKMESWLKGEDPLEFKVSVDGKPIAVKPTFKKIVLQKEGPEIFDLEVSYTWSQTFPAGKTIRVSHEYTPALGSGGNEEMDWKKRQYCADGKYAKAFDGLVESVKKRIALGTAKGRFASDGVHAYLHFNVFSHFSYVLTTAKNWAGPIKSFELVVDKETPETLVTTCFKGLKAAGKTRLRMARKNFVPSTELEILFAEPV